MAAAVLTGVAAVICVIWVWRRGVARRLRGKLIETGVPVCRECGYPLRGLAAAQHDGDAIRCPECGWETDSMVRGLIDAK